MATHPQAAILLPPPAAARYLEFGLRKDATRTKAAAALASLAAAAPVDGVSVLTGFGLSLADLLGLRIPGLREFPTLASTHVEIPSTPRALWIWIRGEDRGEILLRSRAIERALSSAFDPASSVDAFRYDIGRDLTGYEDGTENPKAEAATEAAIVGGRVDGAAPAGSSFVAVQLWQHDLVRFAAMDKALQDCVIGRERISNDEIADAPQYAHVKRTAQESFDPPSFVVRRSMPWSDETREGLMFVAFGATLDAFERQLRRMAGLDDGIVDGVFLYSKPLAGSYYWCPPVVDGRVALSGL
ncbi:MAG TPA: Dyp-type peroxidase [Candidatus Limnocylindrales bacterium]|nr:Dyp-type peroxidase [Candidatus Limnocylindrales bacterium]